MIWRAFQLLSTTATAAAIIMIGLLSCGLNPDGAAAIALVGGAMITSIGELQ